MEKKCKRYFKFMYDMDLFGKEAELYYNGSSKRTSWTGILFTLIYIGMYFSFFIYKVIRMFKKVDVTFYETYAFTGEPPFIKLSKDKFYGGFALGDPNTLQTFIDDSIYYVNAYFRRGIKQGNVWSWTTIPLEIETCQLEKFGENYRDIFKEKSIDKLHCVPILDQMLQGHLTYDVYSYFYVRFFPCINGTKNKYNCKPLSIIKQYLNHTFVTFKMEDIDLTPQLYNSPIALRGKEVSANVGKNLFQDIHSFFQIINIETDEDILGFEGLSKIKTEKYIKYDQSVILSSLKEEDIFMTGDPICDVTISLSEKELTQKRTYPKLIEVLGDVGGLMELFFSFFRIISSFLVDTLYETSLVNHLFNFDLDKKILLLKDKKKKKMIFQQDDSINIYNSIKYSPNISPQNSINMNYAMTLKLKNKHNEDEPMKNNKNNNVLNAKPKKKKKRKIRKVTNTRNVGKNEKNEIKNKNTNEFIIKNEKENDNNINQSLNNSNNIFKLSNNEEKENYKDMKIEIRKEENIERRGIIKRISINNACIYFCFCCARKRKNIQNILLDEGMKIIIRKLDIMNLFIKLYRDEIIQKREKFSDEIIEMSDECKANLQNIYKKNI